MSTQCLLPSPVGVNLRQAHTPRQAAELGRQEVVVGMGRGPQRRLSDVQLRPTVSRRDRHGRGRKRIERRRRDILGRAHWELRIGSIRLVPTAGSFSRSRRNPGIGFNQIGRKPRCLVDDVTGLPQASPVSSSGSSEYARDASKWAAQG
eukprot:762830-Hanusia_phi.AAC.2